MGNFIIRDFYVSPYALTLQPNSHSHIFNRTIPELYSMHSNFCFTMEEFLFHVVSSYVFIYNRFLIKAEIVQISVVNTMIMKYSKYEC